MLGMIRGWAFASVALLLQLHVTGTWSRITAPPAASWHHKAPPYSTGHSRYTTGAHAVAKRLLLTAQLVSEGRLAAAAEQHRAVLALQPHRTVSHLELGRLSERLSQPLAAVAAYRKAGGHPLPPILATPRFAARSTRLTSTFEAGRNLSCPSPSTDGRGAGAAIPAGGAVGAIRRQTTQPRDLVPSVRIPSPTKNKAERETQHLSHTGTAEVQEALWRLGRIALDTAKAAEVFPPRPEMAEVPAGETPEPGTRVPRHLFDHSPSG